MVDAAGFDFLEADLWTIAPLVAPQAGTHLHLGSWRPSLRIRLSDFLGFVTLLLGPAPGISRGGAPWLDWINERGPRRRSWRRPL